MTLRQIVSRFLRIGCTGFGGPMALVGLMQQNLVEKGDVSQEDFGNGVALGQILPGPLAMDVAAYLGYRARGWLGAVAASGMMLLPAFLLMLILTPLYFTYGTVPEVAGFFKGVGPAVVAVIMAAGWRMGTKFVSGWGAGALAAMAFAGGLMTHAPWLPKWLVSLLPVLVVLLAGVLGLIIKGSAKPASEAK